MAVTGDTQTAVLKAAGIATIVQRELTAKGVLTSAVTDVSQFAVKGAKSISFPKANSFVVQNRPSGQMADIQNLNFALDTMPLDQRATVAWVIDCMDEAQVALDLEGVYAQRAAAAHALSVDNHILATADAAAQVVGTAGPLTDSGILALRSAAIKAQADRNNLVMVLGPDAEASMLAIDKFVRADAYGSAVIPNGLLGRYYGMDVFVDNSITHAGDFYVWDKSAIAIGFQREPQTGERPAPEYGSSSVLKVLDMLYGTQALQIAVNGAPSGKSALIFKNSGS